MNILIINIVITIASTLLAYFLKVNKSADNINFALILFSIPLMQIISLIYLIYINSKNHEKMKYLFFSLLFVLIYIHIVLFYYINTQSH